MSTTGLVYSMPADEYHARTDALSSGYVRALLQGPPARARTVREQTPAMAFGSLVHDLLSGVFGNYVQSPFKDFRSKAAQEWRDAAQDAGQVVVAQADYLRAETVVAAVRKHAGAGLSIDPLVSGNPEVSAFWNEPGDVLCRARFDRLICDEGDPQAQIWDWKTCSDIGDEAINKTILAHGYHIQAAFYLRGLQSCCPWARRPSFVFCFVETEQPFAVRRVVLSDEYIRIGNADVDRALAIWRECSSTGVWPDYSPNTLTIEPPSWLADKYEQPLTGMTAA